MDIFYPNNCQICQQQLNFSEAHLCLNCSYDLPYINQSGEDKSKLNKLFWGRAEVNEVYALLHYQKGNQIQEVLHHIKYQGKKKLGRYFGLKLGEVIPADNQFDFIIPVPLHPKKLQKRGYNQSTLISKGIQDAIQVPVNEKVLYRNTHNQSQTKVTKFDRWENVKQIFTVKKPDLFKGKNFLLVDDVLTTGATIEACLHQLLKIKDAKVSVATLAARL